MSKKDLVSSFWRAMQANDWEEAATFLAPDCTVDWPCTGERIVGRHDYVALQADYPTATGNWSFDIHRLVADDTTVVSEVTVTDGAQSARVVAFSVVDDEQIGYQVEYWPMAYEPPPGREPLTRPTERIP